jgi:hypothetical protein
MACPPRKTPSRRRTRLGSSLLCLVLAFLLPLQALAAWALQMAGPAHTHRGTPTQAAAWAESWRPAHPVFRHRLASEDPTTGQPPGFEWAAARAEAAAGPHRHAPTDTLSQPHGGDHATARHHHAAGDASVQAEIDARGAGDNADSDGTTPAAGAAMAWATPCEGLRWAAGASERPRPSGPSGWRDAAPRLMERPPRRG